MKHFVALVAVLLFSRTAAAQPTYFDKGAACSPIGTTGQNLMETLTIEDGEPGGFTYTAKAGIAGWSLAGCSSGTLTGGACVRTISNSSQAVHALARDSGSANYVGTITAWHKAYFGPLGGPATLVWDVTSTATCPVPPCPGCGGSPILIPTLKAQKHDGRLIKVSDVQHGAAFDLNADGVVENLGWPEKLAAFLAIDGNGNGTIDNGRELFGTENGCTNGFEELRAYAPSAGWLDATHTIWSQLLLWTDANRDGVSQPEELEPVSAQLTKIGLGYEVRDEPDGNGNNFKWRGWAEYVISGRASQLSSDAYPIWDVILAP